MMPNPTKSQGGCSLSEGRDLGQNDSGMSRMRFDSKIKKETGDARENSNLGKEKGGVEN